MKSIFAPPKIQFSGTNPRIKWISDRIRPFLQYPILILISFWAFYALLDGLTTYLWDIPSMGWKYATITTVIGFLSSCLYFFWLFPSLLNPKENLIAIGFTLAGICLLSGLRYSALRIAGVETYPPLDFLLFELLRQWVFLIVTFTTWGFYALIRALQEKHKTDIMFDKLKMIHSKGQLSPHFTFNLIGDISTKSLSYSPELFDDLNHFITILRYAYIDTEKFNPLSAEIEAILSYLHGQKVMFEGTIYIQPAIDEELLLLDELYMPKLLLITLVENTFKHGIYQNPDHPVTITAKMEYGEEGKRVFHFATVNKINRRINLPESSFGVGTVRNLLDYFFKNSKLTTKVTQDMFFLNLTIPYEEPNQTWPDR